MTATTTTSDYDETIQAIKADQKRVCPQAKDFYEMDPALFDELWEEIRQYWLDPTSSLQKKDAWKLLKGLRLEAFVQNEEDDADTASASAAVEEDPNVLESHVLELMYSLPIQYPGLQAFSKPTRKCFYWHMEWVDMIPGFRQTTSGHIQCAPFVSDPPIQLLHDHPSSYTHKCQTWRRGWQLSKDFASHRHQPAVEAFLRGANLLRQNVSTEDAVRCLLPAIGRLAQHHPANTTTNSTGSLKRLLLRLEREVQTWNNSKVDVDDNQEVVGTDDSNNNNNSNNEWKETTSPRAGETNKGRGSPISSPTTILDF